MKKALHRKMNRHVLSLFISFCLLFVLHTESGAAVFTREQFQNTLRESLKALWIGEDFSPALQQQQKPFKEMLETGAIPAAELKTMMKKEMLPIINQHKTDRYILQEIPARIEGLFSPLLNAETFKEDIIWGVIVAMLDKEPYVLKLGTLAPEGTPWLEVPQNKLIPKIVQLTNGALQLKLYTGGVMGEDYDVLRKMDIGQLDGCGCTTQGTLKASPEASVFMVPDMFNNYEEIDHIYEKFRKRIDKSFEKKGYICGAIIDSGFLYMFSKYKISGLDDIRKQKTMTCMGNIEFTLLNELGANPLPGAVPEVVSALSSGLADTFTAPAAWVLGMQAYQYVNYYIKTPFFYSPAAIVLSTNARTKIQKHFGVTEAAAFNTQELIVVEIKSIEPEWKKRSRNYEEKSLQAFESKCGIKPAVLSPSDRKAFEDAAQRVREKLAGQDYPRDLLNEVLNELEQFRKNGKGK